MKKVLITVAILMAVIGGCSMLISKNEPSHKEMVEVVRSEEAKGIIENLLKDLDKNALTERGKIKSYTIKEDEIQWNPLGGIMVNMIVNEDEDLKFDVTIMKKDYKLYIESYGKSMKLRNLLESKSNEK